MPDLGGVRVPTRRHLAFTAAFLAVLVSVDWRHAEYFSGSLDPVVVAKGVLTVTALLLAWGLARSGRRRTLGTGSSWLLGVVLTCSLLGAMSAGHLWATAVLALRVVMVGLTVFLLLRATAGQQVIGDLTTSCGVIALVAAVTGVPGMTAGRLAGGIPAMDPNGLALLAGVVVVVLAWRAVVGEAGPLSAPGAVVFLGILWETGSRTALLMLVAAVVVLLLQMRRPPVRLVVGGLLATAVLVVAAVVTGGVVAFLQRNGTGLSTVDSRFVAWHAAVAQADGAWQLLLGRGLSVKVIPVHGLYRATQPLDSTWMSLLVEAGVLGLATAVAWALWCLCGAVRAPERERVLFVGLLVFLLGRSFLESGLFDATPAFLLFLATSLLAEGGSRARLRGESAELLPPPAVLADAVR